jgi:hypothetical protein
MILDKLIYPNLSFLVRLPLILHYHAEFENTREWEKSRQQTLKRTRG